MKRRIFLLAIICSIAINISQTTAIDWSNLGNCIASENGKSGVCKESFSPYALNDDNVESLEIHKANFTWPERMLANMKSLKNFTVKDSYLRTLSNELHGATSLRILRLIQCRIRILEEDALKDLENLELLELTYNYFVDIPYNFFQKTKSLQSLDISHNEELVRYCDAVRNLNNLKKFKMQASYRAWVDIHNRTCFDTNSVEHMNLNYSGIILFYTNTIFTRPWPKLTYLHCQVCRVRNIVYLELNTKPNLEYLSLKGNEIKFLTPNQLVHLKNLVHLDLSNNYLKEISADHFKDAHNLKYLDVSNNPLFQLDFVPIVQQHDKLIYFNVYNILCTTLRYGVLEYAQKHLETNSAEKDKSTKCTFVDYSECYTTYLRDPHTQRQIVISEVVNVWAPKWKPWWSEKFNGIRCYDDCGSRFEKFDGPYNVIQHFSSKITDYHYRKLKYQIEKLTETCQASNERLNEIRDVLNDLGTYVNVTNLYTWELNN